MVIVFILQELGVFKEYTLWEFRNGVCNRLNSSIPDGAGTEMVLQDMRNGDNRLRIGTSSNCRVGIGATNVIGKL